MTYKNYYGTDRGNERVYYNVKKEFTEIKKEYKNFPYEPKTFYHDVRSVYFTMESRNISQLPIPTSWETNGLAITLLESIESYSEGKEIIVYVESNDLNLKK